MEFRLVTREPFLSPFVGWVVIVALINLAPTIVALVSLVKWGYTVYRASRPTGVKVRASAAMAWGPWARVARAGVIFQTASSLFVAALLCYGWLNRKALVPRLFRNLSDSILDVELRREHWAMAEAGTVCVIGAVAWAFVLALGSRTRRYEPA